MLDTRVAHNIVRDHIPLVVKEPGDILARVFDITSAHVDLKHSTAQTSLDARLVIDRVIASLKALGCTVDVKEIGGVPVLSVVAICGNATCGLLAVRYAIQLTDGQLAGHSVIALTPHAIARFLQRTNNPDFGSVFQTLRAALVVACTLRDSYVKAGCRQLAVPAGDGLFVGAFKEQSPDALARLAGFDTDSAHACLELSTWFVPCVNGRDTPWRKVKVYFGTRLRRLDRLSAPELLTEMRQTASRMVTSPTISECFPYLRNPYARRKDAHEVAWDLARQQASASVAIAA